MTYGSSSTSFYNLDPVQMIGSTPSHNCNALYISLQNAEVGRKRFWHYFSTEEWNKREDVFGMMEELKQMRIDEGDEWKVPMDQFAVFWAAVVS